MDTDKKQQESIEEVEKHIQIMEIVEDELEQQKKDAIFCLMLFLMVISAWILIVALWQKLGEPIPGESMTYGVEIIAIVMLIVILKFTRLDINKMGVTKKNLKSSVIRALIVSGIAFAVMVAVKLITQPGQPLMNWRRFDPFYALTSVLQEFLARGFLLTTLCEIIPSKNSRHIAVIGSSLMFTSLHLYYGFTFMVGAGVLSVLLGYCYLKDRNIWGVSITHFLFGMLGIMMELV